MSNLAFLGPGPPPLHPLGRGIEFAALVVQNGRVWEAQSAEGGTKAQTRHRA